MPGRDPILRGTGQSDMTMAGFNIRDVGAVGYINSATLIVDPDIPLDPDGAEIGERATGLPFTTIGGAIAAAQPNDLILLKPGVHAFDGVIDIFHLDGLTIRGESENTYITSDTAVNEVTKFTVRSSGVTFEGISFLGNEVDAETDSNGWIDVTGGTSCQIRRCFFNGIASYCIYGSDHFDDLGIEDCWFQGSGGGILLELSPSTGGNTTGVWIKRNRFLHNRGAGAILNGPGVDNGHFFHDTQIFDNKFAGNNTDTVTAVVPALWLTAAHYGAQVHNNSFRQESYGIIAKQCKNISIVGNNFKDILISDVKLDGCIVAKLQTNLIDGRNSGGVAATTNPIQISGFYLAANDSAEILLENNLMVGLKVASIAVSISNVTGVVVNGNRIDGPLTLASVVSGMVGTNQFSIAQTTQAILIDASDRGCSKISVVGNRFNFSGASINRCVTTVDASATGIDDILIEGNATPVGQTYGIATYGHSGSNPATNVIQIGNTPEAVVATAGWLNVGTNNLTAKVFVSRTQGNDTTAIRQSRNRKFKTISAAITAAVTGDVIVVEDGTFNEMLSLKAGIFTLKFLEGASLVCSTAGGCIQSAATGAFWTVYHEFASIQNSQNTVPAILWAHAGSYLYLHADVNNSGTGTSARGLLAQDGSVNVYGRISSTNANAITLNTGTPVVAVQGGLHANQYDIVGNGTATAVVVTKGQFTATDCTIYGVNSAGVDLQLATANLVTFKRCTIFGAGGSSPAIAVSTPGATVPLLRDCVLVAGASATQSIIAGSAQTIKLYGQTVANKGSDPPTNVTFTGGGTYDVNANVTID